MLFIIIRFTHRIYTGYWKQILCITHVKFEAIEENKAHCLNNTSRFTIITRKQNGFYTILMDVEVALISSTYMHADMHIYMVNFRDIDGNN